MTCGSAKLNEDLLASAGGADAIPSPYIDYFERYSNAGEYGLAAAQLLDASSEEGIPLDNSLIQEVISTYGRTELGILVDRFPNLATV